MNAHLVKIALVVAMSHGFRYYSRKVGPRWGGLALGLPCSTAIALVGSSCERGVDYARAMAESSLIGLVGAVVLPLIFAGSIGRGWRLPVASGLAVGAYLAISGLARWLAAPGSGEACLLISGSAVGAASVLASRWPIRDRPGRSPVVVGSTTRTLAVRTLVPVACLLASAAVGGWAGPSGAGLMSTFPGVTLTVLILTHLEAGPSEAVRMARSLPAGNLGMVAFLATFRFRCAEVGPAWATALGYLAALAALAVVIGTADGGFRRLARWPSNDRRLLPVVEPLAA